ncbi:MAG: hypothetical protein M1821_009786 [Bathelium mastoideum]|nr:MAG: hypothetical protein M1821_009786 [Bathelium mastoideum]
MATPNAALAEGVAETSAFQGPDTALHRDPEKIAESGDRSPDGKPTASSSELSKTLEEKIADAVAEKSGTWQDAERVEEGIQRLGWTRFALVSAALCFGMFIPWLVSVFEVGSILCAAAPASTAFIIGRAIAGIGTAGAISGVVNIITHTVPLRHRAAYLGTVGGICGLASLTAPVLGGAFADSHLTWRWCFWINLPFGAVTSVTTAVFVPNLSAPTTQKTDWRTTLSRLDLGGTALLLPAIVSLLLALQWGGTVYAWDNAKVIALLVLAALLLGCFFAYERWMGERASIPFRIINKKNVVFGALFVFLLDGAFYILDYYLPIWFQAIKGKDAKHSGISSLPFVITTMITYTLVGHAVSIVGYYHPFMLASTAITSTGAGLLTTLSSSSTSAHYIGFQILFGTGIGLGTQLPVVAAQAVLTEADVPLGVAAIMFFQVLGPAVFVSLGQTVFVNRLVVELGAAVPGDHNATSIADAGALSVVNSFNATFTEPAIGAYNTALNQTWYIVVALASLSIIGALGMEWRRLDQS